MVNRAVTEADLTAEPLTQCPYCAENLFHLSTSQISAPPAYRTINCKVSATATVPVQTVNFISPSRFTAMQLDRILRRRHKGSCGRGLRQIDDDKCRQRPTLQTRQWAYISINRHRRTFIGLDLMDTQRQLHYRKTCLLNTFQ